MNKNILFFAVATSFCMQAHWPEDFSFNIDGEINYSCQRHSIMSQLSQEYKDSDCLTDEEVRAMAGLVSGESVKENQFSQVTDRSDEIYIAQEAAQSAVVVQDEKPYHEIKMIVIHAFVQALFAKYKQNLAIKKNEEKPE